MHFAVDIAYCNAQAKSVALKMASTESPVAPLIEAPACAVVVALGSAVVVVAFGSVVVMVDVIVDVMVEVTFVSFASANLRPSHAIS